MKKQITYLFFLLLLVNCDSNDGVLEQGEINIYTDQELVDIIDNTTKEMFNHLIGFTGIYTNLMADQTTTHNSFKGFYSYGVEPRIEINNAISNENIQYSFGSDWKNLNSFVTKANIIINLVDYQRESITINNQDISKELLAKAFFIKGLSQGFLSLLFDKSFIIDPQTDLSDLKFKDYNSVSIEAIKNLNNAIKTISNTSNFNLKIHQNYSITKANFVELAYSFMAKILINTPRTKEEAKKSDYQKILEYANKGITEDFNPPTNGNKDFYNLLQDWSTFIIGGLGYLPSDYKIFYLMDNSFPLEFDSRSTNICPNANSLDKRLNYFKHTCFSSIHIWPLNFKKHKYLSNYSNLRFFTDNDRGTSAGLSTNIFHREELDYIKAEATLRLNGSSAAATILNSSSRFRKGGITTGNSQDDVEKALHYEYSVELDLATTIGTHWFFMRRFDLLQKGTPLSYPVPAEELQILGAPIYTFGGENNAGSIGTATGNNSWKK